MIKLTRGLRELVLKIFLATLLRGSVTLSEKVVYKNDSKLTTTFSMNCKFVLIRKKRDLFIIRSFWWSSIVLLFLFK